MMLRYIFTCLAVLNINCIPETACLWNSPEANTLGRLANCLELQFMGNTKSGVYTIYPRVWYNKLPLEVYCDMKTDGGGWTVFQRRDSYKHQANFFQPWKEYTSGFGDLSKDFWLGNEFLHLLTHEDEVELRIDLEDFNGRASYATYSQFEIGSASENYTLTVTGFAGETQTVPGDSFTVQSGNSFVTFDRDVKDCAKNYKGGWWYKLCHMSNLNGLYLTGQHESFADGIEWKTWTGFNYSLKKSEMKIRPKRS